MSTCSLSTNGLLEIGGLYRVCKRSWFLYPCLSSLELAIHLWPPPASDTCSTLHDDILEIELNLEYMGREFREHAARLGQTTLGAPTALLVGEFVTPVEITGSACRVLAQEGLGGWINLRPLTDDGTRASLWPIDYQLCSAKTLFVPAEAEPTEPQQTWNLIL